MSTAHSPAARRSAAEQARLDAALVDLFEHQIVFNRTLGLAAEVSSPAGPRMHFRMRNDLVGSAMHGRLHGGVISAVLDTTGGFALMVAIGERHADETAEQVMQRFPRMGTVDLRVDYLRQGIGQQFFATAEVTRLGGRIGSTQMRLVNEQGTLIATAAAAYVVS